MQMNIDPRQPRGEPQLVGLTRLRYDPSKLRVEKELNEPTSNYSKSRASACVIYRYSFGDSESLLPGQTKLKTGISNARALHQNEPRIHSPPSEHTTAAQDAIGATEPVPQSLRQEAK